MSDFEPKSGATPQQLTIDYICAPGSNSFWHWGDGDTVITGPGGETTIAFLEEILPILFWLAPRGLHRFGSLVLLLSACRQGWDESGLRDGAPSLLADARRAFQGIGQDWARVIPWLTGLHNLPPPLRDTAKARAAICELVFEKSRARLPAEDSLAIVTYLKLHREAGEFSGHTYDKSWKREASADVQELLGGFPNFTQEKLTTLLQTGTTKPLPQVALDLPQTLSVRSLVAQLRDDKQLGSLMTMVRSLLASIQVPRTLIDPDNLPLGGLSDISNRGPLDRLLLSELAQDDDVLAARVALNEALYLRRETPPSDTTNQRVLLLDAGIRLWGQARLLTCAAGLAVAAASEENFNIVSFRPAGTQLKSVDLATREGLLEHLASLEPDPHPGAALAHLATAQNETDEPPEVVLVTHPNAIKDPEFRQNLRSANLPLVYLVAADQEGTVALYRWTPNSTKLLSTTTVDPTRMMNAGRDLATNPTAQAAATPLPLKLLTHKLPVILSLEPFPLLLPPRGKRFRTVFAPDHGLLILGKERTVHHQPDPQRGARQILRHFPKGQIRAMIPTTEGIVHVLLLYNGDLNLASVDLNSGQCRTQSLVKNVPLPIMPAWSGRHLLVANHKEIKAFDPVDGSLTAALPKPRGWSLRRARFFSDNNGGWQFATVLNDKIVLMPFSQNGPQPGNRIVTLFDQYGAEGPLALVAPIPTAENSLGKLNAQVMDSTGNILRNVPGLPNGSAEDFQFSPNGRHCWLNKTSNKMEYFGLKDYQSGYATEVPISEPEVTQALQNKRGSGLVKLMSAGVTIDGNFYVCTRKGESYFQFRFDQTIGKLVLENIPAKKQNLHIPKIQTPAFFVNLVGSRRTLQIAPCGQWPDGSAAYPDKRGLLHLVSSNPEFPQITLLLQPGQCAAWTTDGLSCGPDYNFPAGPRSQDDRKIAVLLAAFCARLPQPGRASS